MNITNNNQDIKSVMNLANLEKFTAKSKNIEQGFKQYLDPETKQPRTLTKVETDKIKKTSEEFEALFLTNMLEQMYSGMELEKPFGGGSSEGIFRSMLIGKYAENMAASDGIGIASQLEDSMTKMQLGI